MPTNLQFSINVLDTETYDIKALEKVGCMLQTHIQLSTHTLSQK